MENVKSSNTYVDNIIEEILSGRNVLLCSPGGTGKSHTLRRVAKALRYDHNLKVFLTATTGTAACCLADIATGLSVTTLHRFAGVGTAELDVKALILKIRSKNQLVKRWTRCQVLIIDEVSMLGEQLFQKLDAIAKIIRNNTNPFGGICLLCSGDFLQLPPVKDNWIFLGEAWKALNFRPYIFDKPYRYDDLEFFEMLLRIREGRPSPEDIKVLKARVKANEKMQELLQKLSAEKAGEVIKPTMCYSKRADVDIFNQRELEKLEGKLVEFVAIDSFFGKKDGVDRNDYSRMLDETIPRNLYFKVGAQVMLKQNLDVDAGLVNGSRGVVSEIIPDEAMIVKFLTGSKIRVELGKWSIEDKHGDMVRNQIPFVLAWASTIHRLQGANMDFVIADLGTSIFLEGQAYIALSRCKNAQGLFISEFFPSCIKANKDALAYVKLLKKKALEEDILFKQRKDYIEDRDNGKPKETSQELLKRLEIFDKKTWKSWLMKNHPDKGGDGDLCGKVIDSGREMGW